MKTLVNLRGTNGSGKSTLARRFFGEDDATVSLTRYTTGSGKTKEATGRFNPNTGVMVIGNYDTTAGGLDKLPSFAVQFECIEAALALPDVSIVVAEGILASTVMGSWDEHAKALHQKGVRVIWAFFETPVEECIRRVRTRPKATSKKEFKEELVRDKFGTIDRVRQRAETRRWIEVLRLPFEREWECLREVLGCL